MIPMRFSELLGQEKAKTALRQALAQEKLPHAYLFTGIQGIGKTSMARALATRLNCQKPTPEDSCGHCPPCRQMARGNFPDFIEIRPDGAYIKIGQIRELNRKLNFAPVSGTFRLSVLIQAEKMTAEAANSFLKTLEEPPPGNVLVLNATEPRDLLPTIISRCQKISFQPLPVEEISRWLVEQKTLDEEQAQLAAKLCGGSLARAIQLSGDDFFEKRQAWLLQLMRLPGLKLEKALELSLENLSGIKEKSTATQKGQGESGMNLLTVWETWYRDLMVAKTGGPPDLMINMDFSKKLKKTAKGLSISHLERALLAIDAAQRAIKNMRNSKLVMEHLVLQLKALSLQEREV